MRWFRRRCPPVVPSLAAKIVTEAMRRAADDYVAHHLQLGEAFDEDTDGPVVAQFRQLIPDALARRGLQLVGLPDGTGWRVQRSSWPALPPLRAECSICHASIFRCPHGEGVIWEQKE
jgi:hypothetical protein